MRSNNILGLIFTNTNEEKILELTSRRTMGSVPFGGKYRMIDFPLSNMANAGINNVGVITSKNFMSLMDHVGSGNAWDLSKRRSGLTVLPPYGGNAFTNLIETIFSVHGYIENSDEEYVLIAHCDSVTNFDYTKMYSNHIKTGADISLAYKRMECPPSKDFATVLDLDDNKQVKEIFVQPDTKGECNLFTGSMLIKKELLMRLVNECISSNNLDYKRYILQANVSKLKIVGYENKGFCRIIGSINDYFNANMDLFDSNIRRELFNAQRPIYTKVRDDMPSKYGLGSSVKNSLVAQGCVIDGSVNNCIISKGVYIGKGAKVSNCIIMQDSIVGDNTNLNYLIIDKDVKINNGRSLMGFESYPIYITKQSVV